LPTSPLTNITTNPVAMLRCPNRPADPKTGQAIQIAVTASITIKPILQPQSVRWRSSRRFQAIDSWIGRDRK